MVVRLELAPWIGLALGLAAAGCTAPERDFGGEGAGGHGGTGASSSTGCAQPEACFDGADNDCDGETDCADADCADGAVCVNAPTNFQLGVVVGEGEACPEGFAAEETLVYRGLMGGDCAGCGCTANPTGCEADVWYYPFQADCNNDVNNSGGVYSGKVGFQCTPDPINGGGLNFGGVRVSTFQVTQTCNVSGTAAPVPAGWNQSMKFCRATGAGTGCDAGKACVPRDAPARQCALASGSATCEGYGSAQNDWFTGYTDTRSCSSCSCIASGGQCDAVWLELGNDYTCFNNISVGEGQRWCGGAYAPPAQLQGSPLDPTCNVTSNLTGSLDPTGQSTLCCLE